MPDKGSASFFNRQWNPYNAVYMSFIWNESFVALGGIANFVVSKWIKDDGNKDVQTVGIARRVAWGRFVLFGGAGERDACGRACVGCGMVAARDVVFFARRVGGVLVVGFGDAAVPIHGGCIDAVRLQPLPRDGR